MLKILIWGCAAVGFIPVVCLVFFSVTILSHTRALEKQVREVVAPSFPGSIHSHLHDSYLIIGSLRTRWYPRAWTLAVLGLGLSLVVFELISFTCPLSLGESRQ
jgi:hypothetical protein